MNVLEILMWIGEKMEKFHTIYCHETKRKLYLIGWGVKNKHLAAVDRLQCICSKAMMAHSKLCVDMCYYWSMCLASFEDTQGFIYRPDRPNRRGPVPVYRSGLAGNRSEPFEVKFEFKNLSSTGSYRYTGRLDRFTGQFGRYTGDLKKFSDG